MFAKFDRTDVEHAAALASAVTTIARSAANAEINGFPTVQTSNPRWPAEAGPQWRALVTLVVGTSTSQLPGLVALVAGGGDPKEARHIRIAMKKIAASGPAHPAEVRKPVTQ